VGHRRRNRLGRGNRLFPIFQMTSQIFKGEK
jgi:hypothetical protein